MTQTATEDQVEEDQESLAVAGRWCETQGAGWEVTDKLGQGGTAPVYEVKSPSGLRALKIHTPEFSVGEKGEIELSRIDQQVALRGHDCPSLVEVYDGGRFDDRLFVLMSRANGSELERCLANIPRNRIRGIVDQVAKAAIFLRTKDLCHRDIKAANVFVSDDFSEATLLDISVIRNILDPVGVGTDHEGQLPVVATARYSPPEYLFRLLEPGSDLWHALTVYQLGALLHDLIMREPMFNSEFRRSAENRYRFAWIVATAVPRVDAEDVDEDLLLLARRALDKDWKRRSSLQLEDFLGESTIKRKYALQLLGLGSPIALQKPDTASRLRRVTDVARELEQTIVTHLKDNGAQAKHRISLGHSDTSKELVFDWEAPPLDAGGDMESIEFKIILTLTGGANKLVFDVSAKLSRTSGDDQKREVCIDLPPVEDGEHAGSELMTEAQRVLGALAVDLASNIAPPA